MAEIQKDQIGSREDTLRFLDMVSLFGSQAMMALGKLANPMTGKAEKNLDAARLFIDMLEMIEKKTRGNLTADEAKVLQSSLADLRLMFVEESKSPAAPAKVEEPKPDVSAEAAAKADDSKVKFHKSYGEA
ncbi:MAG: hypothetical protein PCFJNLEI_01122 [Verrucomicrobiae bacterium]|nr:hypothetical protein [Verrucomicrobiae bacterium]